MREIFNIIPVKVVKKLKEDEQSNKTDKTSSIKREIQERSKSNDFRVIETFENEISNLVRHLVENEQKPLSVNLIKEAINVIFTGNGNFIKFELIDK